MSNVIGVKITGDSAQLQTALKGAGREVEGFGKKAQEASGPLDRLSQGFKSAIVGSSVAVGLIGLKNTLVDVTGALINAQVQVDQLRNGLSFAVGSKNAVAEIAFVRDSVKTMGLEFASAGQQYTKLAAAARGTTLEGQKTRDIFTAVAQASNVLGLSSVETEGALRSLGQMISKNTVMSEELKGQFSEHIPGGFQIAARAMGKTTEELNKMLETGQVLAGDLLPKMAAEMTKVFSPEAEKAANSMRANMNRLTTAWIEFKQTVTQGGASTVIAGEAQGASNYLTVLSEAMERSRQSGDGLVTMLSTGLGTALARMPFDATATAANFLNGTINLLTGGVFGLKTNINLLPEAFNTSAQNAAALGGKLTAAEAELATLQAQLAKVPDNIYLKSETYQAFLLVQQLRAAKEAQDKLKSTPESLTAAGARAGGEARTAWVQQNAANLASLQKLKDKQNGIPDGYAKELAEIERLYRVGTLTGKEYSDMLAKQQALLNKKQPGAGGISEAAKGLALYNDLMAKDNGLSANFEEQAVSLSKAKLSTEQLTKAMGVLVSKQPFMVKAAKDQAEASEAAAKADEKAFKAMDDLRVASEKQITTAATTLGQIEFETRLLDLNTEARAIATMERELERQGIVKGTAAYDDYIVKLREAMSIKTGREASIKAADDMLDAQKRAAEESAKYWEDALMRAFESGKGFFQSLWDTIKNTLKTQILKVSVQGVMGTLGMGAAGAGGTDYMGMASSLSGLQTAYTKISGWLGASSATASSSIYSLSSGPVTVGANGVAATASGGGASASSVVPVVGWIMAAMAANGTLFDKGSQWNNRYNAIDPVVSITDKIWQKLGASPKMAAILSGSALQQWLGDKLFGTGGEMRGGASYITGADGKASVQMGPSGGEIAGEYARALFDATNAGTQDLLKLVGSKAVITGYVAGLESSKNDKGFAYAGGMIDGKGFGDSGGRNGGQFAMWSMTPEEAVAAYANELKKSTLEALQAATDIPQLLEDKLAGVDINALNQEGLDKLQASVSSVIATVSAFSAAMKTGGIAELRDLSFSAAAGLIQFSGGLENLNTNLGTYYTNFYSAEEQRLQQIKNIGNSVTAFSIQPLLDDLKTGASSAEELRRRFKLIVESQDLTTASGQAMYAQLISVAGSFAQLTPVLDKTGEAAIKAAADMRQQLLDGYTAPMTVDQAKAILPAGIGDSLLTHTSAQARQVLADYAQSLDANTTSGQAAITQLNGFTGALNTLLSAIESGEARVIEVANERNGLETALLQLQGNTAALRERELAALDPSNRALQNQIYALQDAKVAQDAYNTALSNAQNRFASATSALESAQNAVESVRDRATSAYLTAQSDVANAQQRIADIQASAQQRIVDIQTSALRETQQAAQASAQKMRDLGKSLREFVSGETLTPDQNFKALLTKALSGDAEAMQGLSGAATAASALAAERSSNVALAQARIMADVMRVAVLGESTALPGVTGDADPAVSAAADLAKAQIDLAKAQADLTAATNVANTIGASTVRRVDDLIAQYAIAQSTLVTAQAEFAASKQVLEDIKTNTAATAAGVDELGNALTVSLTISAKSEIEKIIKFVGDATALPDDLRTLALLQTTEATKTINIIGGTQTLSEAQKQLALLQTTEITKTIGIAAGTVAMTDIQKTLALTTTGEVLKSIGFIAGSDTLSATQKSLALVTSGDITKAINTTVGASWLSGADLTLALQASAAVTKTFNAALGTQNADALALAAAASSSVLKTISASGGTLTADQRTILTAVANGSSTVTLSASFTSGEATTVSFAANDPIYSVFTNISKTNTLLIDAMQLQLTTLLGVAISEDLQAIGAHNSAFDGTYKVATDSLYYLKQIATESYNTNVNLLSGGLRFKFDRYGYTSGVYAHGGAFTNGIVNTPTFFNQGLMGEAGPEAIMPLSRTSTGDLGVQVQMPDLRSYGRGENNAALVAEIRALRQEVAELRKSNTRENTAIAIQAALTADATRRMDKNGVLVYTDPAEPLKTEPVL